MKATFEQAFHLLQVVKQQEPTVEGLQLLYNSGFQSDLLEAAEKGTLNTERRNEFRNVLGLSPTPPNAEPQTAPSSLRDLGLTITLSAQPECKVADCFTNKAVFAYRDADFDTLFPATLPASKTVSVSGYELTEFTTEEALLKIGRPFTNPLQIENLILRTEREEDTGLLENGCANLFFLQVGTSVFTVGADRHSDGWRVHCYRFDPRGEWGEEYRFFSSAT